MPLRKVTTYTPNQFFGKVTVDFNDVYSSPKVKPSLRGPADTSFRQGGGYDPTNPFGFTAGQLNPGVGYKPFESANIIGQQYPFLSEAPEQFKASNMDEVHFDEQFGLLGSFFGPHIRQALQTPITHREPVLASVVASNVSGVLSGMGLSSVDIQASVDFALGEKIATLGTPEFFRQLYRDMQPDPYSDDPGWAIAFGGSQNTLARQQEYGRTGAASSPLGSRERESIWGGPAIQRNSYTVTPDITYKNPTTAARDAIGGAYQTTSKSIGQKQYGVDMSYLYSPGAKAMYDLIGENRGGYAYTGSGTGEFKSPTYTMRSNYTPSAVRVETSRTYRI